MTCRPVFALSSFFLLAAFAVCGQEQPAAPPIKAGVREVLVPVIVTDGSGNYAADLDRSDFSVFENGKPQKIVGFSKPSGSSLVAESGESAPDHSAAVLSSNAALSEIPKRTYLICLDPLHMGFNHFAQVRHALEEFFAHEGPGESQYVLVALGWQLHTVVDSTRDPGVILAAINSKALLKIIQESEAVNIANETRRFIGLLGGWCGSCQCTSPEMDMAAIQCPALKARVQAALLSFSERMYALDQNFLQELEKSVIAMSSMPTKRTVLFISDGFNRFPGDELYSVARNANVGDVNLELSKRDLQPQLNAVLKVAVRNDVRFYAIDSRGLYTGSEVPGTGEDASSRGRSQQIAQTEMAVARSNSDAMAQLAKQTGGQFFENSNDLLNGIRKTFADGRAEYVLVYAPSNPKQDGKFRRISVKVRYKRLRVAAKAGYWADP